MVISSQGNAVVTGSIIYTPPVNHQGNVNNIKLNNSAATSFTIIVSRYMVQTNTLNLLYAKNLSNGDTVDDDTAYVLEYGDYLYLTAPATVKYVVSGTQYPIA